MLTSVVRTCTKRNNKRIMATLYTVLGCQKTASYEELKKKYQELVLKYHPDKQVENCGFSPTTFFEIDEAWKILRDPERRKLYDNQLARVQLSEQSPVYATLCISELEWNEDNKNYSYLCRCGGMYIVEQVDVQCEDCFVNCDDCSLIIYVKCDNK